MTPTVGREVIFDGVGDFLCCRFNCQLVVVEFIVTNFFGYKLVPSQTSMWPARLPKIDLRAINQSLANLFAPSCPILTRASK